MEVTLPKFNIAQRSISRSNRIQTLSIQSSHEKYVSWYERKNANIKLPISAIIMHIGACAWSIGFIVHSFLII